MANVGCEAHLASINQHESVGLAERFIHHIKEMPRHFIDPSHKNWQERSGPIEHALNNGFCGQVGRNAYSLAQGTIGESSSSVLPFSKLNNFIFGYFDPENIFFNNENKQFSG